DYRSSPSVALEELERLATEYTVRVKQKNNRLFLYVLSRMPGLNTLRPIRILVTDLNQTLAFTFRSAIVDGQKLKPGLNRMPAGENGQPAEHDVAMHSNSLGFIFRFHWGDGTLTVNGRFQTDMAG